MLTSAQDFHPIFSWENSEKKQKKTNHRAPLWPGATPPPQRLRLFFSLECGSKVFSQPLQRATTGPRSLGSTEGVEPGGRGAYVTQHAQEASRWEKKTHRGDDRKKERKRMRSLHLKGVFNFWTRALALWERQGEKKHSSRSETRRGRKKICHVFFSDSEAEGMCLKALGLLPKNLSIFTKKSKGLAANCKTMRLEAEVSLWFTFELYSVVSTFAFCLQVHASWWELSLK